MATPTLSECMNDNLNSDKAQGCYDLSIEQSNQLTKNAQWEIQNNAITNMKDDGIEVENDSDLNRYTIIHNTCEDQDNCITKNEWTNLKLLKAFINNYQEWKSQEEAAIQKEITEYMNGLKEDVLDFQKDEDEVGDAAVEGEDDDTDEDEDRVEV